MCMFLKLELVEQVKSCTLLWRVLFDKINIFTRMAIILIVNSTLLESDIFY